VGVRQADYVAVNRPIVPGGEWPAIGVDVIAVGSVIADPCEPRVGPAAQVGPSAEDLARWLGSLEVLGASEPVLKQIAGRATWVLDEGFAGTPDCPELQLWDNDGGWIFPQEHKRLHIFEVGGVRMVAIVMAPDATFDRDVAEGETALGTLRFEGEPAN
jgi:hypothetical protein